MLPTKESLPQPSPSHAEAAKNEEVQHTPLGSQAAAIIAADGAAGALIIGLLAARLLQVRRRKRRAGDANQEYEEVARGEDEEDGGTPDCEEGRTGRASTAAAPRSSVEEDGIELSRIPVAAEEGAVPAAQGAPADAGSAPPPPE